MTLEAGSLRFDREADFGDGGNGGESAAEGMPSIHDWTLSNFMVERRQKLLNHGRLLIMSRIELPIF